MTELREALRGFKPGQPQIVGNMAVIPLLNSEVTYEGIAGAENVSLADDRSYNSLYLRPVENQLTIVPNGHTYVSKQAAQDRAVPGVHLLKGGKTKEVQAYCVQSSQCGHLSGGDERHEKRLLPLSIRQYASGVRHHNTGYSALWSELGKMNRSAGVSGDYLVDWFKKFKTELESFVASFEPVPRQRGAIVLINGRVVGIDIAPNSQSWLGIWEQLIRDSYGSEALRTQSDSTMIVPAKLSQVQSLDNLLDAVMKLGEKEKSWAFGIVKSVLDQQYETSDEETFNTDMELGVVTVTDFKTAEIEGQAIFDANGLTVYMSAFRYAHAPATASAFPI